MKPKIVLSGVNFTEMGPLSVFKEAIASLAAEYADSHDIIALVHQKDLFDVPEFNAPGVSFLEFPAIKSSWLRRLRFEYWDCRRISEEWMPYLWFAMHDITPNVRAEVRAVYCHNPSPFYKFSFKEALLDWKFGLFTLFYRFLYGINIRANDFVVVQQDWIRSAFKSRYGVQRVVVAHPSVEHLAIRKTAPVRDSTKPYRFFYPAYPRTFKNIEQILGAARELERTGFDGFEVWLTMTGTETPYAAKMVREFGNLGSVRWLGVVSRSEVMRLYDEADCLLFSSKLETWGLPLTEFKSTGKPILAVDLPYAHETVGDYGQAAFFIAGGDADLAEKMKIALRGGELFHPVAAQFIDAPVSRDWQELWKILLES